MTLKYLAPVPCDGIPGEFIPGGFTSGTTRWVRAIAFTAFGLGSYVLPLWGGPQLGEGAVQTQSDLREELPTAVDLLTELASHDLSGESRLIEFEYEYGINFGEPVDPSTVKMSARKRVLLEQFTDGSSRELSWLVGGSDSAGSVKPFSEVLFDGARMLRLETFEEGDGYNIVLTYDPTVAQSHGMRGDGVLVFLGKSGWYTPDEWNAFQLARQGNHTIEAVNAPGGRALRLKVDSDLGHAEVELDERSRQLRRVEFRAVSPAHFFSGGTLEEANKKRVVQEFHDFEYAAPATDNLAGLKSWRVLERHEWLSGRQHQVVGRVHLIRFALTDEDPVRFDQRIRFQNEVREGASIGLEGNPHLRYTIRNGRLEVFVDERIEDQLAQSTFHELEPVETGQSGRVVFVSIAVLVAVIAVTVVVIAGWRVLVRGKGERS